MSTMIDTSNDNATPAATTNANVQAANDREFLALMQAALEDKQKAGNDKPAQLKANKAILSNFDSWRAHIERESERIEQQIDCEEMALRLLDAGSKDEAEKILAEYNFVRKSDTPPVDNGKPAKQPATNQPRKPVKRGPDYVWRYIPAPGVTLQPGDKPGRDRLTDAEKAAKKYVENPAWVPPAKKT